MTKLVVSEGFERDMGMVESDRVFERILSTVKLLETMPFMGSRDVPESIARKYEGQVRKIPVNPFDIVTIYHPDADIVEVAALIHQRGAW